MKFLKSWDDKRYIACSAFVAVIVALVLIFFAGTPRARLNVMKGVTVLFFAVLFIALWSRGKEPAGESEDAAVSTAFLPAIGMVFAAGIWAAGFKSYFINDGLDCCRQRVTLTPNCWSHSSGEADRFSTGR